MLALLIGLLVAAGPLLRGCWDLWAQSLLFTAVAVGFGGWLSARTLLGYIPLPSARTQAWAAGLALLAGLSAVLSPIATRAVPAWRCLTLGLWVFPAVSAASKDERAAVDEAVRVCAWILVALAFYQRYHENITRPYASFLNTNVFAGTCLMLLPLAVQKRDWLLSVAVLTALAWSHSVGAWLGLAGALILTRRNAGAIGYWAGVGVGFVCMGAIYAKLKSPDVVHRWQWWLAAARMAAHRPWFGFGPGAYALVMPSFQEAGADLSTLYAHQHFLETAAECGLPYLLLWTLGLAHFLRRGGSHKRFGALAVLIQSVWDYPLSIPANFWLFCYFAASSAPQTARGLNVAAWRKPPAAGAILAATLAVSAWVWRDWSADRLRAAAVERFTQGAAAAEVHGLLARSLSWADDAETQRLSAEMDLKRISDAGEAGRKADASSLAAEAAAHLERSAALNPYRPSTWAALERLYGRLGEPEKAAQARRRGSAYGPQPPPDGS